MPSFLKAVRAVTNNYVGAAVILAAIILLLLKFSLWGRHRRSAK